MWIPARFRPANAEFSGNREGRTGNEQQRRRDVPAVLAITSDDRLYYLLLSASIDLGWKIAWARTIGRAFERCCSQPAPLIVYDECLPGFDWREVLPRIAGFPDQTAVVLAASRVSEEVWRCVLQRRGYDAVQRTSGSEEWKRQLGFAWLSIGAARGASAF